MQKAFSREWWADSWGGRGLVCDGLDLNVFFLLSLALPHSMKPEVKGKHILYADFEQQGYDKVLRFRSCFALGHGRQWAAEVFPSVFRCSSPHHTHSEAILTCSLTSVALASLPVTAGGSGRCW